MLLDTGFHQGSSLSSYTPQANLRMLAVISQSDATLGLETLWQVCSSLQRLGYPVAVLDGTARESAESPGLLHLLQDMLPMRLGAATTSSLAVVPAAHGLARLAGRADWNDAPLLARLHPLFRAYALVVLYAPPETLAPVLRGSASVPLVMTSPGSAGVIQSYRQLKHMAVHAGLQCTVASIVPPGTAERAGRAAGGALATLQRCAARHLGAEIRTTTVQAASPQDIQRLALQLLENACTIDAAMPLLPSHDTPETPAHFVRSH